MFIPDVGFRISDPGSGSATLRIFLSVEGKNKFIKTDIRRNKKVLLLRLTFHLNLIDYRIPYVFCNEMVLLVKVNFVHIKMLGNSCHNFTAIISAFTRILCPNTYFINGFLNLQDCFLACGSAVSC
jgi:hypothetical protein